MKERVLVVFNTSGPVKADEDYTDRLKRKDWETEADVKEALSKLRHEHELVGVFDEIDNITHKINTFAPTIIFNLVERFNGNTDLDRDVASFLELKGVPFTGCGATGLTLCKNKGLSKKILSYHRIRVPEFMIIPRKKYVPRPKKLKYPFIVKPLTEEASIGIAQSSFVENDNQFLERVNFIHERLDGDVIAEEYIDGRELYVSVIGNEQLKVFPFREIKYTEVPDDEPKIASYKAKWDEAYRKKWGIRNQFAGQLANGLDKRIEKVCKKIYHLLMIRGYARLDLRLTPDNELYFLEANPNPMLSSEEDFAQSASKAGVTYPDLIQKILNMSKSREE